MIFAALLLSMTPTEDRFACSHAMDGVQTLQDQFGHLVRRDEQRDVLVSPEGDEWRYSADLATRPYFHEIEQIGYVAPAQECQRIAKLAERSLIEQVLRPYRELRARRVVR